MPLEHPLTLWGLSFRHRWLTTSIGAVLSGIGVFIFYQINGSIKTWSIYAEVIASVVYLGLIGGVCGLLGIWWVRLIFRWAATTGSPREIAGIGLLLTYLFGMMPSFLGDGFNRFTFLLLVWCAASLLALCWVPLQAERYQ